MAPNVPMPGLEPHEPCPTGAQAQQQSIDLETALFATLTASPPTAQAQELDLAFMSGPLSTTEAPLSEPSQVFNANASANVSTSVTVTADDRITTGGESTITIQVDNVNSSPIQSQTREEMITALAEFVIDTVEENEPSPYEDLWQQGQQLGLRLSTRPPSRRDLERLLFLPALNNSFRILPPGNLGLVSRGSTPVDMTLMLEVSRANVNRRLRRLPPYDRLNDTPANHFQVLFPGLNWDREVSRDGSPPGTNIPPLSQPTARQAREPTVVPPRSTAVSKLQFVQHDAYLFCFLQESLVLIDKAPLVKVVSHCLPSLIPSEGSKQVCLAASRASKTIRIYANQSPASACHTLPILHRLQPTHLSQP
jgi:hypothetical protein